MTLQYKFKIDERALADIGEVDLIHDYILLWAYSLPMQCYEVFGGRLEFNRHYDWSLKSRYLYTVNPRWHADYTGGV